MDRNIHAFWQNQLIKVALRKESVDRNTSSLIRRSFLSVVALRKESVDRNLLMWWQSNTTIKVALRKESVDRNTWPVAYDATNHAVALRKESVDRNMGERSQLYQTVMSLSARRAWIEICQMGFFMSEV